MRKTTACAWLILSTSCATHTPPVATPQASPPVALNAAVQTHEVDLFDIARAEAKRAGGIDELIRVLGEGDPTARRLAARALGRSGGERAIAALLSALSTSEGSLRVAIIASLGMSGEARAGGELAKLVTPAGDPELQVALLDALGRIGTVAHLTVLESALRSENTAVRSQAALSLGLFGRRQIALNASIVQALSDLTVQDASLAYAVAYALARQHEPSRDAPSVTRLRELSGHADPEVRAMALSGLTRREIVASDLAGEKLDDADARVRVQAVRNLTQKAAGAKSWARVASWVKGRVDATLAVPGGLEQAKLVAELEALEALRAHGKERGVRAPLQAASIALKTVRTDALGAQINLAALRCNLATVHDPAHAVARCEAEQSIDRHLLLGAALQSAPIGVALAKVEDEDPRVRGAALVRALGITPVAEKTWTYVPKALTSPHPTEAGTVVEALMSHVQEPNRFMADVAARTARELDEAHPELELVMSLFGLLSATKDKQYAALCERAQTSSNRTLRKAAFDCVSALGTTPEARAEVVSELPNVRLLQVQSPIALRLETSKGDITIALDPRLALWSVSAIEKLAREGFYDGLPFHRVVGDFVVQGGDPTGSGWGGPEGLTLPAEPSVPALGGTFQRGAVGMADAGPDTAGSQFFIMHSRAAHLEGRYTQLGHVVSGIEVLDRLIVGDRVLHASLASVAPVAVAKEFLLR